ncbi:hypothetical protein PIB30_015769 [Stylosanthes scabra]|uniref:RING-type E3 ubiquitin transferase n=1 Tax=Stylosanthes scabra TaxID=79078 RepID=A0ABU6Y5D4_9FABA|nr:hypothetical protein [Stylosanthes scabra]
MKKSPVSEATTNKGKGKGKGDMKKKTPVSSEASNNKGKATAPRTTTYTRGRKRKHVDEPQQQEQAAPAPAPSSTQGRSFTFQLSEPDVLDCPICFDPLTIPVYQCENGHVACSTCCIRLEEKCPTCCLPIGSIRVRVLEKLLESMKVPCSHAKYGCSATFSYTDKRVHESNCLFVPCYCPHTDCDFVSSFFDLPLHFISEHGSSAAVRFSHDKPFAVTLSEDDDEAIVLQEETDDTLFVLHNFVFSLGKAVNVCCIQPDSLPKYRFEIMAKSQGSSLEWKSFTMNIQSSNVDTTLSSRFLVIPSDYFGDLEICIHM